MVKNALLLVAMAGLAFSAGFAVAETLAQSGREPQFENSAVKVWKTLILPNNPLPLHRHEHPRVIIALRGGSMKILQDSGNSELHEWQTGKAYWLDASAPGSSHQDVNVGDKPIEVMVVELEHER